MTDNSLCQRAGHDPVAGAKESDVCGPGRTDPAAGEQVPGAIQGDRIAMAGLQVLSRNAKTDWSLNHPCITSCPGRRIIDERNLGLLNTSCGACYGLNTGQYRPATKQAQLRNLQFWQNDPSAYWARLIEEARPLPFLRLFAYGDMPSPAYALQLADACRQCPGTRFWVSTKTLYCPEFHDALRELARVPNVTVRGSTLLLDTDIRLEIGRSLPRIDGMTYATTVRPRCIERWDKLGHRCAGGVRTGCAAIGCRACWSRECSLVIYQLHTPSSARRGSTARDRPGPV